ncbi:MAG: hypothetical protein VB061_02725 [Christensenella sp.]|nr:hypothetical protein [Christensenella sp.]
MKKRAYAALLIAVMLFCLPLSSSLAKASPDTGIIQLGTDSLEADDIVYFGVFSEGGTSYNVPWYILNIDAANHKAFLLSKYSLTFGYFQHPSSEFYPDSEVHTMLGELFNGTKALFTSQEQSAILDTTLTRLSMHEDVTSDLTGQKLFLLSRNEVEAMGAGNSKLATGLLAYPTTNYH